MRQVSALGAFVHFTIFSRQIPPIILIISFNSRVSHVWGQVWFSVVLPVFPLAVPRAHYAG